MLISRGGRESAKLMNKGFYYYLELIFSFFDDLHYHLFVHVGSEKVLSKAVFIENALDF